MKRVKKHSILNVKAGTAVFLNLLNVLCVCETALLQRVKAEDADLLQSLLPRVQELTQRCSKGMAYASQVNTSITHW